MNKKTQAELFAIASRLPDIYVPGFGEKRSMTGEQLLAAGVKEIADGSKVEAHKKYVYDMGRRKVDHFKKLKEEFRKNRWESINNYVKNVQSQSLMQDQEPLVKPKGSL